ncbi:MAG: hypothetical protein LBS22_01125 [Puniceicoccales bacterium]|jgi:hypothetical protein|nr:hypothetical protein [Puniceicoccales bacterium]
MDILALAQRQRFHLEIAASNSTNAELSNLHPTGSVSKSDSQIQPTEVIPPIPQWINDIELNALLSTAGRNRHRTSGDGHNNCGFNAILEQVGDRTHTSEMVNLLRHRLKYGDESSNEMFDSHSCLRVADLFKRPVVELCYNSGNSKITQLSFSVPAVDLSIHLRNDVQLSQNFVQWCKNSEWQQDRIDILSQWLETNLSGMANFNTATPYDVALQLLRCPRAIALISIDTGGHFDAAPYGDLPTEGSVLELLRKEEEEKKD